MLILSLVAEKDIDRWKRIDSNVYRRINELINSIKINPIEGIGKPERIKNKKANHWSRRINREHRLIYEIEGDTITILSARYHYKNERNYPLDIRKGLIFNKEQVNLVISICQSLLELNQKRLFQKSFLNFLVWR